MRRRPRHFKARCGIIGAMRNNIIDTLVLVSRVTSFRYFSIFVLIPRVTNFTGADLISTITGVATEGCEDNTVMLCSGSRAAQTRATRAGAHWTRHYVRLQWRPASQHLQAICSLSPVGLRPGAAQASGSNRGGLGARYIEIASARFANAL